MNVRLKVFFIVVFAAFVIGCYANVPTGITDQDKHAFEQMGITPVRADLLDFEKQIEAIREVQAKVFAVAPLGEGIPEYQSREPADLIQHGQGVCYDRSRSIDKGLNLIGFETRHVFLIFRGNRPFLSALFRKGQPSHAVTEVKTSKGWMIVGSNNQWIALTREGEPVGADEAWRRKDEFDHPPEYLANPWWAIRGLYSRRGQLYGAGIPIPEVNWADFSAWLIAG